MANIIPLAGNGLRFSKAGYTLPKPLIPVSGKAMIERVIESLPSSDKWIFIIREEHKERFAVDRLIKRKIPDAIVIVDPNPRGQAASCALALRHLEPDESMFVAACDNGFLYDAEKYKALLDDATIDSIIWTFTKHESLVIKPESWGWVKTKEDGVTIEDVSVKVPISDDPFNDHAIVATFFFRRAKDFKAAYELMIRDDYRINGELYIDPMPIFYDKLDKKSVLFDVDLYIGWGKPEDLYLYQEWEYKVRMDLGKDDSNFHKWQKFIKSLI